jgi:hypothetical protein
MGLRFRFRRSLFSKHPFIDIAFQMLFPFLYDSLTTDCPESEPQLQFGIHVTSRYVCLHRVMAMKMFLKYFTHSSAHEPIYLQSSFTM